MVICDLQDDDNGNGDDDDDHDGKRRSGTTQDPLTTEEDTIYPKLFVSNCSLDSRYLVQSEQSISDSERACHSEKQPRQAVFVIRIIPIIDLSVLSIDTGSIGASGFNCDSQGIRRWWYQSPNDPTAFEPIHVQ